MSSAVESTKSPFELYHELQHQGLETFLYKLADDHVVIGLLRRTSHISANDDARETVGSTLGLHVDIRSTDEGGHSLGHPGDCFIAFAYDLHWSVDLGQGHPHDAVKGPVAVIAELSSVAHHEHGSWTVEGDKENVLTHALRSPRRGAPPLSPITEAADLGRYEKAFAKAQNALREGDTYQLVISHELHLPRHVDRGALMNRLATKNAGVRYSYALDTAHVSLFGHCAVPHIEMRDGRMSTLVVAGTSRLSGGSVDDSMQRDGRYAAEHLMLVDLERHDFAKVSEPGSMGVHDLMVSRLSGSTSYLTTGISSVLSPDVPPVEYLLANFPRGVVSGAPKARSLRLINDFEQRNRGFYGGCIGLIGSDGRSVATSTVVGCVMGNSALTVPTGGGVTIASTLDDELAEIAAKRRYLYGPSPSSTSDDRGVGK